MAPCSPWRPLGLAQLSKGLLPERQHGQVSQQRGCAYGSFSRLNFGGHGWVALSASVEFRRKSHHDSWMPIKISMALEADYTSAIVFIKWRGGVKHVRDGDGGDSGTSLQGL